LLKDVLDHLGTPDGFSRQFMYSRTRGTAKAADQGGTLRFLLADKSELHVWSGNLTSVDLAILYSPRGRGTLLFK
jgi:hypothetical protein